MSDTSSHNWLTITVNVKKRATLLTVCESYIAPQLKIFVEEDMK